MNFEELVIKNKASIWLCFAVLIVSAVMHMPSFASLIALAIEAALLAVLRWCAHIEGQAMPR